MVDIEGVGDVDREYGESIEIDVSFCVEFGNSEECTRFLHEEIWELQNQYIEDKESNVAAINAIMRALVPIHNNLLTAEEDAAQRCVPYSQFIDECSQPETQLIHHRGANRGDDRPCYVTLQITISDASSISGVGWTATNIPPAIPSRPSTFRSLSTLHLKFPSRQSQERTDDSASSSHHEDLTITISAREITFIDGTNSTSAGNSFSVNSVHRTVNINYINNTGDAFLAPISSSNVGGQNNVNTIVMEPPPDSQSPVELSRAQGILLALARRRARLRPKKAEQSARGTSRSAKLRTQRAGPY
ncbi:hypothetical protein EYR38_010328 [Pleurotus pulmonarius]|nr:hypothetical protein EYR38_010328 [Pleurotus pulmonarius]